MACAAFGDFLINTHVGAPNSPQNDSGNACCGRVYSEAPAEAPRPPEYIPQAEPAPPWEDSRYECSPKVYSTELGMPGSQGSQGKELSVAATRLGDAASGFVSDLVNWGVSYYEVHVKYAGFTQLLPVLAGTMCTVGIMGLWIKGYLSAAWLLSSVGTHPASPPLGPGIGLPTSPLITNGPHAVAQQLQQLQSLAMNVSQGILNGNHCGIIPGYGNSFPPGNGFGSALGMGTGMSNLGCIGNGVGNSVSYGIGSGMGNGNGMVCGMSPSISFGNKMVLPDQAYQPISLGHLMAAANQWQGAGQPYHNQFTTTGSGLGSVDNKGVIHLAPATTAAVSTF